MVHILKTPDEVLEAAAAQFVKLADEAISKQGRFTVALSGGSSPKGLFELLVAEYASQVAWNKVYFFFGDERYVPADDPESNALMAKKALFEPLNIAAEQVFAVNTAVEPKEAASQYQQAIEKHFATGPATFDLVLLGLGDDAHTASLFPHTDVIDVQEVGVRAVFLPGKQVYRITLTAPLINQAHHIVFLLFGSSKADAVKHVFEDTKDYHSYPAQIIEPIEGDLVWFMDEAAGAKLKI